MQRELHRHIDEMLLGPHLNRSLPSAEENRAFGPSIIACSNCGDSNSQHADHGRIKIKVYWADTTKPLGSACESYLRNHGVMRPAVYWPSYRMPGKPQCWICLDDEPDRLQLRYGKHVSTLAQTPFDKALWCFNCRTYWQRHQEERPEQLWLPHLRRKLACNGCGQVEGVDDNPVRLVGGAGDGKSTAFCEWCYGPDTAKASEALRTWRKRSGLVQRTQTGFRKDLMDAAAGQSLLSDDPAKAAPMAPSNPRPWESNLYPYMSL